MKIYKNTDIFFQGSYEYKYLESLECEHGIQWIKDNVKRVPTIKYIDPNDDNQHLYFSDFIVDGIVVEVKSSWAWNGEGNNKSLEQKNVAKLDETSRHFDTVLVLDGKSIKW